MLTAEAVETRKAEKKQKEVQQCYHCGQPCLTANLSIGDKSFCCEGCKLVYEIINSHGLCNYYELEHHPGLSGIKSIRTDKFAFLDEPSIAEKLCSFTDGNHTIVTFYIPGVHCSSCIWLLEHLHRLNVGVCESRLYFGSKEVTIHFS